MSTSAETGEGVTEAAMAVFFTGREKLQEYTVTWIIDDMKVKMEKFKPGEKVKTDTFSIRDTKWHFDFYPNGNIARHKGKISIFLVSENEGKVTADCEFSAGKSITGGSGPFSSATTSSHPSTTTTVSTPFSATQWCLRTKPGC